MTMISESRAAAADTRHRISYPNARPRAFALVGLGEGGAKIARRVGEHGFAHVQILSADEPAGGSRMDAGAAGGLSGMAREIAAAGHRLGQALGQADMIFLVATPADDLGLAAEIGQLGRQRNILITGILVTASSGRSAPVDSVLKPLRAATDMLVIVSDASYIPEMLSELGGHGR